MVEQASRPQRLWPGLALLLAPAALIGGLSTSAEAQSCGGQISSSTAGATITNNGCIATSGYAGHGIISFGSNATITNTNSGTITTNGSSAHGIASVDANATIDNSGIITTNGTGADGIYSSGLNATITNSGTITTSGLDAFGINSVGANATITNSGTITTSGASGYGIYSNAANATITNSGTITAPVNAHGIFVGGSGATLSNMGTITAGAGFFGIRVGGGSVVTLTNAQGGNTPLTYSGALPATYNVVVRSLSSFGRLAVTSPTGSLTFGVDAASVLAANRYTDVLTGVAASTITNEETEYTLGRVAWTLTAGSAADSWDLLARLLGPDAANTQTMVYLNSFDVNAALTHRTMVIDQSLSYDCSIFDANNICVSWGGRYGNSGNSINDGAGVLTVAYRFLPEFYVGAFVDQSAPMDYGTSIRSTGMDPTFGGFLVWQENPDQSGFRVRLSAARHNGNVRITREASLSDTEAGTGKTGLHSWGYGADISYGFNVDEGVLLSPYAGIRRSTARRQGYTEETSDNVEYPLSYRNMDRELTTATSGIRGMMRIEHGIRLLASAGMEYDVQTSQDAMTGTSSITDFENFSLSSPTRKANRTRGAGSVGAQFPITSNAAFVVNTSLRQQAYTSDLSLGVMASVMVGF